MFEDLCLANKQLRFVLIFLMVCLLLNRREIVRQLLNQLKVLIDECKRTFQPWVMKRETVIGKKNCHQILTKVGLSNLFVPITSETVGSRRNARAYYLLNKKIRVQMCRIWRPKFIGSDDQFDDLQCILVDEMEMCCRHGRKTRFQMGARHDME